MAPNTPPAKEGILLDRDGNVIRMPGGGPSRSFGADAFEDASRQARIRVFGMSPGSRILLALFLPVFIVVGLLFALLIVTGFVVFSAVRRLFRLLS